jgi:hypothetical protein
MKNINFDKRLRKRGGSLIYYCTRGFAKGVEVESIIARGIHLLKSFFNFGLYLPSEVTKNHYVGTNSAQNSQRFFSVGKRVRGFAKNENHV